MIRINWTCYRATINHRFSKLIYIVIMIWLIRLPFAALSGTSSTRGTSGIVDPWPRTCSTYTSQCERKCWAGRRMCCDHLEYICRIIGYLTKQLAVFRKRTWSELNTEPHRHGHAAVMDHMESCYLARLLAQHEENLQTSMNYCESVLYCEWGSHLPYPWTLWTWKSNTTSTHEPSEWAGVGGGSSRENI